MSNGQPTPPLVSFCVFGRNDNYGGNFLPRLELCANLLARSARRAGCLDRVEWLCADWNGDTPLAGALALTPDAARIARFVRVPPALAAPRNAPGLPFNYAVAANTAIRRARGTFVGVMPGDILFAAPALQRLVEFLEGRVPATFDPASRAMAVMRRLLPPDLDECALPFDELERYLERAAFRLDNDLMNGSFGGTGLQLAHRALWERQQGTDERYGRWAHQDVEFFVRSHGRGETVELSPFGISCFDPMTTKAQYRRKHAQANAPLPVPRTLDQPDWGLGNETLEETRVAPRRAPDGARLFPDAPPLPGKAPDPAGRQAGILSFRRQRIGPLSRWRFLPFAPPWLWTAQWLLRFGGARSVLEGWDRRWLLHPVLTRWKPSSEYTIVLPPEPDAPDTAAPFGDLYPYACLHSHRGTLHWALPTLPEPSSAAPERRPDLAILPWTWIHTLPDFVVGTAARLSPRGALLLHGLDTAAAGEAVANLLGLDRRTGLDMTVVPSAGYAVVSPSGPDSVAARLDDALTDRRQRHPGALRWRWWSRRWLYGRPGKVLGRWTRAIDRRIVEAFQRLQRGADRL